MVEARFENDTTTVEVSAESQTTTVSVGGIQSHSSLTGRNLPDQHSMDAITGLLDAINGKQDVLISGDNIKTINNESILGEGNLQVDVINQGTETPIKLWIGAENVWESNNIAQQHPDWLCFVMGLGVMLGNVRIAECVTPPSE